MRVELKIYRGNVFQWMDGTEVSRIEIGRAADCRVRLDDPSVDPHQATIDVDASNVVRFTEGGKTREVKSGDSLFVGVFRIEVRFDVNAVPSVPAIRDSSPVVALVPIRQLREPDLAVSKALWSCRKCGYWLSAEGEYCADCGAMTGHPKSTWRKRLRDKWRKVGAGSVGAWGLGVGAVIGLGPLGAIVMAAAGAGIGTFFGDRMGASKIEQRELEDKAKDSLEATIAAIDALLAANKSAIGRMEQSRKTVEQIEDPEERKEAHAMLDRKTAARNNEQDLLVVKKWTIEFARWVNCYLPVYVDIEQITFEETEKRMAFTRQLEANGRGLIDQWQTDRAAKSAKGKELIATFEEAIAGLAVIRNQLARANAQLADPDATHLPTLPMSDALRDELAKFATLSDEIAGGRFSMGAGDLEAERLRLEAEAEVAAELGDPP